MLLGRYAIKKQKHTNKQKHPPFPPPPPPPKKKKKSCLPVEHDCAFICGDVATIL